MAKRSNIREISAAIEYKKLLKDLKTLIKEHKDESRQGEALRRKMDKLWPRLTERERKKINKNISIK